MCAEHDIKRLMAHGEVCECVGGRFDSHRQEILQARKEVTLEILRTHVSPEILEQYYHGNLNFFSVTAAFYDAIFVGKQQPWTGVYVHKDEIYLRGDHAGNIVERETFAESAGNLAKITTVPPDDKGRKLTFQGYMKKINPKRRRKAAGPYEGEYGPLLVERTIEGIVANYDRTLPPSVELLRDLSRMVSTRITRLAIRPSMASIPAKFKELIRTGKLDELPANLRDYLLSPLQIPPDLVDVYRPVWRDVDLGNIMDTDWLLEGKDMDATVQRMLLIPQYFLSQCRCFTFDPHWFKTYTIPQKYLFGALTYSQRFLPRMKHVDELLKLIAKLTGLEEVIINRRTLTGNVYDGSLEIDGVIDAFAAIFNTLKAFSHYEGILDHYATVQLAELQNSPSCQLDHLCIPFQTLNAIPHSLVSLHASCNMYHPSLGAASPHPFVVVPTSLPKLTSVVITEVVSPALVNSIIQAAPNLALLALHVPRRGPVYHFGTALRFPPKLEHLKSTDLQCILASLKVDENKDARNSLKYFVSTKAMQRLHCTLDTHTFVAHPEGLEQPPPMPSLIRFDARAYGDKWVETTRIMPALSELIISIGHPSSAEIIEAAARFPEGLTHLDATFLSMTTGQDMLKVLCDTKTKTLILRGDNVEQLLLMAASMKACQNVTALKFHITNYIGDTYTQAGLAKVLDKFVALKTLSIPAFNSVRDKVPGYFTGKRCLTLLHINDLIREPLLVDKEIDVGFLEAPAGILSYYPCASRAIIAVYNCYLEANIDIPKLLTNIPLTTREVIISGSYWNKSPVSLTTLRARANKELRVIVGKDADDALKRHVAMFYVFPHTSPLSLHGVWTT
jgi:hypothetical protein